jgi:archaeoflavoprotein AfpA
VWGITGSGDLLPEVVDKLQELSDKGNLEITACLSKAGQKVVRWYKLEDRIKGISKKVLVEIDANTPFIAGPLQVGKYHSLLIAPTTANTVAKIVHGIADSLITNAVAQAQKGGTPIIVLPVDQRIGEQVTILPTGKKMKLVMREIDIENVEKLKNMKGITVLESPKMIGGVYSAEKDG